MNRYEKVLLVLLLLVMILFLIVYGAKNQKVETSIKFEENQMNSGDSFSGQSGENIDSGDVLGVSTGEENDSGETMEKTEIEKTNPDQKDANATKNTQKLTSNTPYYIKINNSQNVVTIYAKDEEGNYTIPYKAMVCSIGDATPEAGKSYKITNYKKRWNALQGNVYGQYATQIIGNILFHSVPYTAKKNSALEYWEYDKLGTAASLGCVRLTVEDAKWIYDNIVAGTIVEFYEDDNPGPLGKPRAKKISNNEECRDWDPTDLAEGNPWHAPKEEVIPENIEPLEIESGETKNNLEKSIVNSGDTLF